MREAERREAAAVEYANALEKKRKLDLERFNKVDSEYNTKFAESVKSEMDAVQKQLATAIESLVMRLRKFKQTKELLS